MDPYRRHVWIYRFLSVLVRPVLRAKFNLSGEKLQADGPFLLVSNHVTGWDPLLVGVCLGGRQAYFVASEHIFRLGLLTKVLHWLLAPIPRRKASTGMDTVKACLRHLHAGHSVCLFAEGEQCWDGRTDPIFPATGKLAKSSGAALVTFRLEGGYLSLPRWGKHICRGAVHGHPVGVYSPEELKKLTPQEINALIERDIAEDAWERQRQRPVRYRGKRRAEGMERALYACPGCRRIGTLRTDRDRVFCPCGFERRYTEYGFFEPREPFETLADWDLWQRELLRARDFAHEGDLLFQDEGLELKRIQSDHREELLALGTLRQFEDRLDCADWRFPLPEIRSMAMVQTHLLLFSSGGNYYQLRSSTGVNLRKYLEIWKEL
ncbi:MAG: 1-acyl-sn-glycerol-3-phosphate acyltransferase [Oscillospiraceae bacterium]|nr:1-acyl-sn-glycerol-3-phosphate acyltransferase [Oscillospiraceae bacterium]